MNGRLILRPATRLVLNNSIRYGTIGRRFNSNNIKKQDSVKSESIKSESTKEPKSEPNSSNSSILWIIGAIAAAAGGYYYYQSNDKSSITASKATFDDYQKVYNAIAQKLEDSTDWDDGSYGPILVRLAWHSSGNYSKYDKTGGSGGGTMRFAKEFSTAANSGLEAGKKFLDPIHSKFPWISYGDLYTLGGVCSIQELGGPKVGWKAGRVDKPVEDTPPDGRLPDASQRQDHVRQVFTRLGFDDEETVALIGAHCLGRCHTGNSGFDGPWTFSPTVFTNDFFKELLDEKWHIRKWNGPEQYEDNSTKSLMMLPADYSLLQDKNYKKYVEKFAKDNDYFFKKFSQTFEKLLELGVKFPESSRVLTFKTLEEQEDSK